MLHPVYIARAQLVLVRASRRRHHRRALLLFLFVGAFPLLLLFTGTIAENGTFIVSVDLLLVLAYTIRAAEVIMTFRVRRCGSLTALVL